MLSTGTEDFFDSAYYFDGGWNRKAMLAFAIGSMFSVASVWVPALSQLSGYAWLLGALLGAVLHYGLMHGQAQALKRANVTV